jgi:AraC-like DNA-binding protein
VNFISVITLIGAAQGLFLTLTLLAWQRGNRRSNAILSLLFLTMSISLINGFLLSSGLYKSWTMTLRWYDVLRLLTGPLIYLYVREMVVRPLTWRDSVHIIPTLLYLLYLLPFFLGSEAAKINYVEHTLEGQDAAYTLFSALRPWYNFAYIVVALGLLREYSQRIRARFASLEVVSLRWLWNIILGVGVMVVLAGISGILTLFGILRPVQINLSLGVVGTFWMYGIAYFALQKTISYSAELRQLLAEPISSEEELKDKHRTPMQTHLFANKNFISSHEEHQATNTPDTLPLSETAQQLLHFMEEAQPYLDNQLTVQKLAELSSIPTYRISEILNKELGSNFFDFINRYRIEKWKKLVSQAPNTTIQELAFQVGFNSKSSFNTAFKKHTGRTPSSFRADIV